MKYYLLFIILSFGCNSYTHAAETNEIMAKFSFSENSKEFFNKADLTNPAHTFEIAQMYDTGDGVAQNSSLALMWFIISEHLGAQASGHIETTAASMAPDQILNARSLAQIWIDENIK